MVHMLAASGTKVRDPLEVVLCKVPRRIRPKVVRLYPTVVGCDAIRLNGQRELFVQLMVCGSILIEGTIMGGAIRTK